MWLRGFLSTRWEGADYGFSMRCDSVEEAGGEMEKEKDPLADSGYIELHYYQFHPYQYLVLPGEAELDLE